MNIEKILAGHKKWLNTNRMDGERANLNRSDLRGADLCGAYFYGDSLRGDDLCEKCVLLAHHNLIIESQPDKG